MFAWLLASALVAPAFADGPHVEIYGAKTHGDVDRLKAAGFDQLALSDPELIAYADGLGMRVTVENWFNSHTPPEEIQAVIDRARDVANLASVNLVDEPMFWGADQEPGFYAPEVYEAIRRAHGGVVPLSLTEFGPRPRWTDEEMAQFRRYVRTVDLLRLSIFPVASGLPDAAVGAWLARAQREMGAMVAAGELDRVRPLTTVLQAWSSSDDADHPELPTVDQLRVMACAAVAAGVTTVSFFDFNPTAWERFAPGYTDALFSLVARLRQDVAGVCGGG